MWSLDGASSESRKEKKYSSFHTGFLFLCFTVDLCRMDPRLSLT